LAFTSMLTACVGDIGGEEGTGETPFALGNPNMRIAIVGAGPSGLTAAYELRARGYTHVTVFEKEGHVGGKVNTAKVDLGPVGKFQVEMGAVFASPDYTVTLGLADQYHIPYAAFDTPRFIYDQGVKRDFASFLINYTHGDLGRIQRGVIAYATVLAQYPQIFQDKLSNLPPELTQNFSTFVASRPDLDVVAELAKSLIVGFGYGYYDNVPAIYLLKILNMLVKVGPAGFESPPYFSFPTGYQSLWQAVANGTTITNADGTTTRIPALDVRLFSKVTNIVRPTRAGRPIKVTVNYLVNYDFDAVIVSAPLSAVEKFATLTSAEKDLFRKVESSRYYIDLFTTDGHVPPGEAVFIQDTAVSPMINHIGVWANPGGGIPVFQAYQIADRNKSVFSLDQLLAQDIHNFTDGEVVFPLIPVVIRKEWPDYFPRVNATDMKGGGQGLGFYDKVEALQGSGGLYYVGGTLSFETVETSARYAKSLVDERFPATF
jgi:hypothetical protein